MIMPDHPPANYEVEDQLKRILASARFRNALNPSAFLELVVNRALKGKKTTGRIVADSLFSGKLIQGESTDVRVTALNLRNTLEKYYDREGSNDVVVIAFPKPRDDKTIKAVEGEAYTPRFFYNPRHETYIALRVGHRYLGQSTYRDYREAFRLFAGVLTEQPGNLGATLGMVETLCKFADRQWDNPAHVAPFSNAIKLLSEVRDRAQNYWRFWALMAYSHKGQDNGELTASFYDRAFRLDRKATESFLPYIEFLNDTGKTEEALGLAQRYVNERVEDSTAIAQYGQILCCAKRWDIGIGHLQAALAMNPANYLAHETLAVIRFIQKDVHGLSTHLHALKMLCDAESFAHIVQFLERHEEQYNQKGLIARLLA